MWKMIPARHSDIRDMSVLHFGTPPAWEENIGAVREVLDDVDQRKVCFSSPKLLIPNREVCAISALSRRQTMSVRSILKFQPVVASFARVHVFPDEETFELDGISLRPMGGKD